MDSPIIKDPAGYGLDLHCTSVLEEYCRSIPSLMRLQETVMGMIRSSLDGHNLLVAGLESRIKTEDSLAGKLKSKGSKYTSLSDITDILGARIITFYSDDVDKVAALMEQVFVIDWENSVDKRQSHDLDSFGYMSLHYICTLPESFRDDEFPGLRSIRFEVQMRSLLQHAWANLNHDSGYKSGIEIPRQYLRKMSRLAGILELADEEISAVRNETTDYRRKVRSLVGSGDFDQVQLDGESFRSYLEINPFSALTERIAAINQAEVVDTSLMPFLPVFLMLGCKTLGDVEAIRLECTEDAFRLAVHELGSTDLDIISASVGVQNICLVKAASKGAGEMFIEWIFDRLYGKPGNNKAAVRRTLEHLEKLNITK